MPTDTASENKAKKGAATLSIITNAFLAVSKIVIGFFIGSMSIISEGIHSGIDLLGSVIAFFSVKKSSIPPDSDHAFGHGKYEDASGMIEAFFIVAASGILIWESVTNLISGESEIAAELLSVGMVLMAISAVIKFVVSLRVMKVARDTHSIALESDAWHIRFDVLTSVGVFAGLLLIQLTGLYWIDSVIAIGIAIFILREAYHIIKRSFNDLMDKSLSEKESAKIREIIERHDAEYTNYHGLKTRKAGSDTFVEFHLMMPCGLTLTDAHKFERRIKEEIKAEIPRCFVVIYVEPCSKRCGCDTCTFVCKNNPEMQDKDCVLLSQ